MRRARPVDMDAPIRVLSCESSLEPGVFGVFRPVLLLPAGIAHRLEPAHLRAIVAHELCHVRRRDNLAAALHMLVEALFWFHPLVWWVGARMVEERERACDEEVLRLGNQPRVYAESILKTCQFFCGIAAGLHVWRDRRRSEETNHAHHEPRFRSPADAEKETAFSQHRYSGACLTDCRGIAEWQGFDAASQSDERLPAVFEVASIRPADPSRRGMSIHLAPGGRYEAAGMSLKLLVENAFDLHDFQVYGGPAWVTSAKYDILAKGPDGDSSETAKQRRAVRQRLQSLLADRFQFKCHTVTKNLPIYAMVIAKGGPKLARVNDNDMSSMTMGGRQLSAEAVSMPLLAENLSSLVKRVVQDRTGLPGQYRLTLQWTPDDVQTVAAGVSQGANQTLSSGADSPSIFTAMQEQLGLKLEPRKGPVEILVIDHVEKPSEN